MFLGSFRHTLDNKFRLTVPSRYRNLLATGVVITRSPNEPCLMVFPMSEWEQIAAKIDALPKMDQRANRLRRSVFSNAESMELDKQGRILLSQFLREFANIDSEVVLAGMHSHVEIWHPEKWQHATANQEDDMMEAFDI